MPTDWITLSSLLQSGTQHSFLKVWGGGRKRNLDKQKKKIKQKTKTKLISNPYQQKHMLSCSTNMYS